MNWKEFFKPTKLKILIFLILVLFSYFTLFKFVLKPHCFWEIAYHCEEGKKDLVVPWALKCRACMTQEEFRNSKILNSYRLLIWPQLADYFFGSSAYFIAANPTLTFLELFVFPPIYFYLISCLTVFLYNKFKSKRKK